MCTSMKEYTIVTPIVEKYTSIHPDQDTGIHDYKLVILPQNIEMMEDYIYKPLEAIDEFNSILW